MKKLLLTGFEPFLNFPVNPTMRIVEELSGTTIGDYEIVGRILTVDFKKAGKQLLEHYNEVQPDAVISLGLAGGRYKITPERIAINCSDGDSDNSGNRPVDEKIEIDGEDGLFTTLPIRPMVEALLQAGYPAEISNTAGTYLCNHVMYTMLHQLKKEESVIPSGFIHIPASHELAIQHGKIPSMSHQDLLSSIKICIQQL